MDLSRLGAGGPLPFVAAPVADDGADAGDDDAATIHRPSTDFASTRAIDLTELPGSSDFATTRAIDVSETAAALARFDEVDDDPTPPLDDDGRATRMLHRFTLPPPPMPGMAIPLLARDSTVTRVLDANCGTPPLGTPAAGIVTPLAMVAHVGEEHARRLADTVRRDARLRTPIPFVLSTPPAAPAPARSRYALAAFCSVLCLALAYAAVRPRLVRAPAASSSVASPVEGAAADLPPAPVLEAPPPVATAAPEALPPPPPTAHAPASEPAPRRRGPRPRLIPSRREQ